MTDTIDGLLCYCRAGFEPELAAELSERAARAGLAGHARTERGSGFVVFAGVDGAVVSRALPWREFKVVEVDKRFMQQLEVTILKALLKH